MLLRPSIRATLLPFGLLAITYFVLGRLSLLFAIPPGNASAIWPAAGVAVAMCLLYGYRLWPAVVLAATAAAASTPVSLPTALAMGIGNTLGVLAVVWLTRRFTRVEAEARFHDSADVFRFVAFAAIGSTFTALVGTTALLAEGATAANAYVRIWGTWFLGDLTGISIFAPLVITGSRRGMERWSRHKQAEFALFALTFGLCGVAVFTKEAAPLLFLFLPFIVWLAFRFSQREVSQANVMLALIAVAGTASGTGPLAELPFNLALLFLQLFVSAVGITGLALAATVDQRREANEALKNLRSQQESLVAERTRELAETAEALRHDIARREKIQQELLAKDRQLEQAQCLAHLGSWEWDAVADHLTMSAEMARIYDVPPDERGSLTYEKYLTYIPTNECHLVDAVVQSALTTLQQFSYEHHVVRPDGEVRFLHCRGNTEVDARGKPVRLYGTAHDVTEDKQLRQSLQEAEELYRKLVELTPHAIYLLHERRYVFSNAAGIRLMGATSAEQLIGRPLLDFIDLECKSTIEDALQQMTGEQTDKAMGTEGKIVRLDGTTIDIELAATPFGINGKQDTLLIARDISERKKAEQEIHHFAHHDTLTGLANRKLFKERLEHAIAQSQRNNIPLAVLFIDLDRFKAINDTAGHGVGDQVLNECAHRLRACLRDSDTVARAGGDEFLILLEAVPDPLDVPTIVQKALAAMKRPFIIDGKEFSIGASIGISTCPDDGTDVDMLIRHADTAMYRAKTEGKGTFRYYSAVMTQQSLERYAMESALRHALERGELELYFQPKIDLRSGRMSGAEALVRWHHPEHGMLMPHRFVHLAEDMGMIAEIGLWAIAEVCQRCHEWRKQGLGEVRVAVNLAFSQFSDQHFFDKVERLLGDAGLNPGTLELEITESMVMQNAERLMSTLQQLRKLGVHLSIDDFGTGYSSLAYLKRLPVDSVKVDRSFIRDLPADTDDVAITRAVLALVHSLKHSVVAEGVETAEQLRFLIDNGCDEGQGFYFSPPLAEPEFRRFLREGKRFEMHASSAVA